MRVQHNIMAMNAYRNYTNNTSAMQKNLERLSSGYRINRAGDDAAGLAISEKMRAQITGLETAQKNAKDGISLVQTAEGALTEVHDMLNRMVELATQSANGTYSNDTDREQLQKEVNQLRSEIDRIAESANFNGIKLLDGSLDGADKTIAGMDEAELVVVQSVIDGSANTTAAVSALYKLDIGELAFSQAENGKVATIHIKIGGQDVQFKYTFAATGTQTWNATACTIAANGTATFTLGSVTYSISIKGSTVYIKGDRAPASADEMPETLKATIQIEGENGKDYGYNNGIDLAVHLERGALPSTPQLAHGKFELRASMLTDGAKLTIGSETYVFKVGKDSTVTDADAIDLSAYEVGDSRMLYEAVKLLTQITDNTYFDISTDDTVPAGKDSYTIYLREKAEDDAAYGKLTYSNSWDLEGTSASRDANWNQGVLGGEYEGRGVVMFQAAETTIKGDSTKSLTLQIGDTADSWNQLRVNIGSTKCSALGIDGIDISLQDGAIAAVDKIKSAINQVSDIRGTLGATQNRLDHTINNLSVMTENIQDAESTIRDTDVAEEMMAYTKNNILIQSAQAMLAQANQVPQGVLQLLQ